MAKLTKKEIQLLRKLKKSKLYPDLQEQLVRDLDQFGAEGISSEKNKNRLMQEVAPEILQARAGGEPRPVSVHGMESTPAGGNTWDKILNVGGKIAGAVAPVASSLATAGMQPTAERLAQQAGKTSDFINNGIYALINRPERVRELTEQYTPEFGPEEAKKRAEKQANIEMWWGRAQQTKQLPNEMPEDFAYRQQQREFIQPYMEQLFKELSTRKPDTLLNRLEGAPTRGLNNIQQLASSGAGMLGDKLNSLGSNLSGGIQGLRSRLNPQQQQSMNPKEQLRQDTNPLSAILDRALQEKLLGKNSMMQGKAYNLDASQYPGLMDLLNSPNNFKI